MKKRLFRLMAMAAVALSVCSCGDPEVEGPEDGSPTEVEGPEDGSPTHRIVVIAAHTGQPATRSALVMNGDNFQTLWVDGDRIGVWEMLYGYFDAEGKSATYQHEDGTREDAWMEYKSDVVTTETQIANFSITTHVRSNPKKGEYRYLGVSPDNAVHSTVWTGDRELFGASVDRVNPHARFVLEIPVEQRPTASSFDPRADISVSNMEVTKGQVEQLALKFYRVGSMLRLGVSGLPAYSKIKEGRLTCGPNWAATALVTYDPEQQSVGLWGNPTHEIRFKPQDVICDANGVAYIWLRTTTGILNDWVKVEVTLEDGSTYVKSQNRESYPLELREGQIAAFSLVMEKQ